ncbi:MAG TPA: exopolysaccharide biosynthesis protein [Pseudobdellovibrionaceae bacterium]|nr:exopolysaccharide biosynthesis protein [Pseudobdellovibrionaceae bacterium]
MNLKLILTELKTHIPPEGATLGFLLKKIKEKGYYILVLILSVPFIQPVPLPGISTIFGVMIAILGFSISFKQGKPPHLSYKIYHWKIPHDTLKKMIFYSLKMLNWIEKFIRPMGGWKKKSGRFYQVNGIIILISGLVLSLPLPIPFSNALPAWTCLLMSLAHIEEDERLLWLGYGLAVATFIFFAFLGFIFFESIEFFKVFIKTFKI